MPEVPLRYDRELAIALRLGLTELRAVDVDTGDARTQAGLVEVLLQAEDTMQRLLDSVSADG